MTPAIPVGLYVHYPWCLRKCPYCDFNSHADGRVEDSRYVAALLADLASQREMLGERSIDTLFIGGGTPSLLGGEAVAELLAGIDRLLPLSQAVEITLEANPGAVDADHFAAYRSAGVNRLSIGVQSFDDGCLQRIGRVHDRAQALRAIDLARAAGFDNLNLDLMFGLPGQSLEGALDDLQQAIAQEPEHLSWYQLTLEPNTPFHHAPPPMPDDDQTADMQQAGQALLAQAGLQQYEVSAYAREGRQCRHNLNYWHFGDYLAIGAGAHGKRTDAEGVLHRYARPRGPRHYLQNPCLGGSEQVVDSAQRVLEFMLNALRLKQGVPIELFSQRTGLDLAVIERPLQQARARGLLSAQTGRLQASALGWRFLNDLIGIFDDEF